jgi:putative peptidoglycan lipid II flippase
MTSPSIQLTPNLELSPAGAPVENGESLHVARSAGIVSIAILLSRFTGLAREMVMSRLFGAGYSYDAFLLGFRIPNMTRDLFAEGSLSAAFIPTFTAAMKRGGQREAAELANLVGTAIVTVVGLVCIAGMVFAPELVWLLAPGFATVPGKFALAVRLTRLMFPFLLCMALAAQAMGILNSYGQFGIPAIASVFFNAGSIVFGLLIGFWVGPSLGISAVEGMAYGVVIGGFLQLVWHLPSVRRLGFGFRPAFNWSHPGLRLIFRMMLPALVASAAVQINLIVNTSFASSMVDPVRGHDGPVSWLAYAFRLVHLPLGMFGIALASAMLPSVSRSAAMNNIVEFRKTLSHSLCLVFVLTIPSSLVLVILSKPLAGAIYQGGRFSAYDTSQTAIALCCYATGLAAFAAVRILAQAFYALSDSRTPMYVSLLSVAINISLPILLRSYFSLGFAALALTTAFAAIVESLCLAELLRRKLGGIEGRYLADRLWRMGCASLLMAVPLMVAYTVLNGTWGASRGGYLIELAICLPVGLLAFLGSFRLLRIEELKLALEIFAGPLRRTFGSAKNPGLV